ncbi:uncharacterized protein BO95DRAFT_39067 [Aspergillus brunneoviolaceus CBS 621.78]|uniref:Uncharacterized protein n=1 Tax=Aspergillus brunneoviolaceus CBS 621.78 TaxID=1450534 RepID=A0ACD1GIH6_9EURO|nr:hypothetical protein BO95DRAFT_39067 [Aspergillus brunneoviolaceus CBS 621.78]RAH48904.1 hypothetical protein BO95DRAFT_39067 [Aspergillus brunneoviolaceus CBS 621.78]
MTFLIRNRTVIAACSQGQRWDCSGARRQTDRAIWAGGEAVGCSRMGSEDFVKGLGKSDDTCRIEWRFPTVSGESGEMVSTGVRLLGSRLGVEFAVLGSVAWLAWTFN